MRRRLSPIRHLMMLTARSHLLRWKWKRPLLPGSLPLSFIAFCKERRDMRCEEILNIQAMGLKKRIRNHIHCQKAMVGLSGDFDSTLAFTCNCTYSATVGFHLRISTALPCRTLAADRTYQNACKLSQCLGVLLSPENASSRGDTITPFP